MGGSWVSPHIVFAGGMMLYDLVGVAVMFSWKHLIGIGLAVGCGTVVSCRRLYSSIVFFFCGHF